MEKVKTGPRSLLLALALFVLAPLVGEFLLGNLPITMLWALLVLAPLYGGGALLIRETARRFGLRWPGILLLGLAYAVLEEAFVTQSLFNPGYAGLRLLDFGYMPVLGVGAWWTVFVLALHSIWSTATPIALVEAFAGERRRAPWLGKVGLATTILIFVFGCVASAMAPQQESFRASLGQFVASALIVALLLVAAFVVGRRRPGGSASGDAAHQAPRPRVVGVVSLCSGSAFMGLAVVFDRVPAAANVAGMFAVIAGSAFLLARWARTSSWSARHELAVACGYLLTYAWYGFVQVPSAGETAAWLDTAGNVIFAAAALGLALAAAAAVSSPSAGAAGSAWGERDRLRTPRVRPSSR